MADEINASTKSYKLKAGFAWYSTTNFVYYLTIALKGYLTVFLQSLGYSATDIGILNALNSGVGIVAQPFWGALSDKLRSVKKVLIICIVFGSALYALIPLTSNINFGPINIAFIFIPAVFFFTNPTMTLFDNFMVRSAAANRIDYGRIRAFGALSYAMMGVALGFVLPYTGISITFYMSALIIIPPLVLIGLSQNVDENVGKKRLTFKEMQIGQIAKSYYLLAFILFTVFLRIPNVCAHTFLPYLVSAIEADPAQIGFITGFRAFIEIPAMFLLKPLSKKMPLHYLIILSGLLYGVGNVLNSYASNVTELILYSVIYGFANGLMLTVSVRLVYLLSPEHLKATTQTLMGAMGAIAGIIGSLIGGRLVDTMGVKPFYAVIGIITAIASIIYAASYIFGEKVLKISKPSSETEG